MGVFGEEEDDCCRLAILLKLRRKTVPRTLWEVVGRNNLDEFILFEIRAATMQERTNSLPLTHEETDFNDACVLLVFSQGLGRNEDDVSD